MFVLVTLLTRHYMITNGEAYALDCE